MTPRASGASVVLVTAMSVLTIVLGYVNKARCAGPPFDGDGRSIIFDLIKDSSVCYSDIQFLWLDRGIDLHLFPYLSGAMAPDGTLVGGAVEYPVLSGVLMWLGAVPAHTDAEFLFYSAILLAPFGVLTAWMLGRLAGKNALLWAAGPALVLYAFHNWELPVVATSVGAVYVMTTRLPIRIRSSAAAALLAIGFCLKLYPGAFVLPLALFVLAGGVGGREKPASVTGRYDVVGAAAVVGVAGAVVTAINLPFALFGYDGWRASFAFQQSRQADITTNSIWYWGLRRFYVGGTDTGALETLHDASFQDTVSIASPLLVLITFAAALWFGWHRYRVDGVYPWVAVSAVMLCGFLLFHKVHSPQYTLWLVPFFVLLRVPWTLIGAYLVADLSMGIGVFKYFGALAAGTDSSAEEPFVLLGVWGRAILLCFLIVAFARAHPRTVTYRPAAESRTERGQEVLA